jgi:hypothetical protein
LFADILIVLKQMKVESAFNRWQERKTNNSIINGGGETGVVNNWRIE